MIAPPKHQRGVALLVALLVVALAVILIAALLDRGELALARTRNALRAEQAEAYAQGLEQYAAQALLVSESQDPHLDTNTSVWALPLPPQPVPGGVISATMRDLNGCFNLNNLAPKTRGGDPANWGPIFDRLLAALGMDRHLAGAVTAWLGSNTSDGPAASAYLALPIPYRPRNDVFVHVSELRLVLGVTGDVYARLAPYVCVLPPGTKINLNTASVPVLQSLGLAKQVAQSLWNNGQANYTDPAGFAQNAHIDPTLVPTTRFGVASDYFLARGDIVLDEVPFTFYSLIERGSGSIRVLERSRGSDEALVAPAPIAAGHTGDALSP